MTAITAPGGGDPDIAPPLAEIRDYYTGKVARYGPTPRGVDWSCMPTQDLRLVQLLRLCDFSAPFELNDLGCGYGALVGLLGRRHKGKRVDYLGMDLSELMIRYARARWRRRSGTAFAVACHCVRVADYSLASGIFNVKLSQPLATWEIVVANLLRDLHRSSRRGFAVNFMLPAAHPGADIPQLYRPLAQQWVRYCEQELGCTVTLLEQYGLREYTLLARPRSEPGQLQ